MDLKSLQRIAEASVYSEKLTGLPAEFTLAQCALESGWLDHCPGNNPFGIKDFKGSFGRQLLNTLEWFTPRQFTEFMCLGDSRTGAINIRGGQPHTSGDRTEYKVKDWFATFNSLEDAFARHGSMLVSSKFYKDITSTYMQDSDLDKFMQSVSAVYATSPAYIQQIRAIVKQNNVQSALTQARSRV